MSSLRESWLGLEFAGELWWKVRGGWGLWRFFALGNLMRVILLLSWDGIDFGVLLGLSDSILHFLGLFLFLGQFLGGLFGLLLGELVELGLLLNSLSEGLGWVGWTELLIIILLESKLFWVDFAL